MTAFARFHSLIPTIAAAVAGLCGGGGVARTPAATLEDWVWQSGIAALAPAAAPPLGVTQCTVLAIGTAALAAAVSWSVLYLLFGRGGAFAPKGRHAAPTLRRADAHPDAPARWPMNAADLGTPLMEVPPPVERPLPRDLDQTLAAFHPGAILPMPLPPAQTVRSLAPANIMETFEALRAAHARPEPAPRESVEAMFARLETHARSRARTAASR